MSVIIDKMTQEIINRSNLFEEETKGTKSGKALLKKYGGGSYATLFDDNEDD